MKIAIIAAMDKEYELLKDFKTDNPALELKVVKSGVGKVNAALCAHELIKDWGADLVISTGVGGAIGNGKRISSNGVTDEEMKQDVKVGDVVVAERAVYHDVYCGEEVAYGQVQDMPLYYEADKRIVEAAERLGEAMAGFPWGVIRKGLMVTGDWFVDTVEKAEAIRSKFGDATVIDMESAAIAQACYKHGKGFASIRMVSDTPLAGNNREQYDNFWAEAPKWIAESVKMIINKM